MFVQIHEDSQEFRPVTLTITFETEHEFAALYHRLNLKRSRTEAYVEKYALDTLDPGVVEDSQGRVVVDFVRPLFNAMDLLATERGAEYGEDRNGKVLPEGRR